MVGSAFAFAVHVVPLWKGGLLDHMSYSVLPGRWQHVIVCYGAEGWQAGVWLAEFVAQVPYRYSCCVGVCSLCSLCVVLPA